MVRHLVDYVAIVELISDDTVDIDLDEDTHLGKNDKYKIFVKNIR